MSDCDQEDEAWRLEEAELMSYFDHQIHEDEMMGQNTRVVEVDDLQCKENISRFIKEPWDNVKFRVVCLKLPVERVLECQELLCYSFEKMVPRQLNGKNFIMEEDLLGLQHDLVPGTKCRVDFRELPQDANTWILTFWTDNCDLIAMEIFFSLVEGKSLPFYCFFPPGPWEQTLF